MILSTALICGCFAFGNLDHNKAKAAVEALIKAENTTDYKSTSQYYTDDFNSSETMDARTSKLEQMHDAFGDLTGMDLVTIKDTTDPNELKCVELIYKVKHTKLTSVEDFTVINDEGKYKVELHGITKE